MFFLSEKSMGKNNTKKKDLCGRDTIPAHFCCGFFTKRGVRDFAQWAGKQPDDFAHWLVATNRGSPQPVGRGWFCASLVGKNWVASSLVGCGCQVCFRFCVFPKAGAVPSFSIVRLRRGFFAAAAKGTCRSRRTGFFCSLDPLGFLCAAGYRFSMLFDSLSMIAALIREQKLVGKCVDFKFEKWYDKQKYKIVLPPGRESASIHLHIVRS